MQRAIRAFILVVGGFTLLAFLFADPVLRYLSRRDQAGSVERVGFAAVAIVAPPSPGDMGAAGPGLVDVRFHGAIRPVKSAVRSDLLRPGERARIRYHVGRSGAIYVDSVEPAPLDGDGARARDRVHRGRTSR